MSEQNRNQQPSEQEKQVVSRSRSSRSSSNPLGDSPLMGSVTPTELPTFPPPAASTSTAQQPSVAAATETHEQQAPLLYNTPPPPAFTLRPFEQRHDRQTVYIDARKAGALDALVQLVARKNKTDLFDEMVSDILAKHAEVLRDNEEMVRLLEERYRIKHNL